MQLARVIGNVVATRKVDKIMRYKLLVVEPIDLTGKGSGKHMVAIDAVQAGPGEIVFIVEGSSARMAVPEKDVPIDTAIIAIVDAIEHDGRIVFRKTVQEFAAV
ncbi:MAG: hypothetical protein A3G34_10820 [Candidatus Lindowbacteria bacterium RIFCSPLOWO2_12_FULL_62_27]|nr:MAG: hypothetical protein A3G34_10820 [Candidatus Lindowbacteria bacterium RIFCSPLOWO2_12_FULL_62_27]